DNAAFDWTVSAETLLGEFPDAKVWRPVFEPGDAIFLDHHTLHRTGAYPGMTKLRYALESWWLASSAHPQGGSTPIPVSAFSTRPERLPDHRRQVVQRTLAVAAERRAVHQRDRLRAQRREPPQRTIGVRRVGHVLRHRTQLVLQDRLA